MKAEDIKLFKHDNENGYGKNRNSTYEDFFLSFLKKNYQPEYEIKSQAEYIFKIKDSTESTKRTVYYDFYLKSKRGQNIILIELDDGSHVTHQKDNNDELKDKAAIRFGFRLIRIKASVYMYGTKTKEQLMNHQKTEKNQNSYSAEFVEPYGEKLLKAHLDKCLEKVTNTKTEVGKGIVVYCPDGNEKEHTSSNNYKTGILEFGKEFKISDYDFYQNLQKG